MVHVFCRVSLLHWGGRRASAEPSRSAELDRRPLHRPFRCVVLPIAPSGAIGPEPLCKDFVGRSITQTLSGQRVELHSQLVEVEL